MVEFNIKQYKILRILSLGLLTLTISSIAYGIYLPDAEDLEEDVMDKFVGNMAETIEPVYLKAKEIASIYANSSKEKFYTIKESAKESAIRSKNQVSDHMGAKLKSLSAFAGEKWQVVRAKGSEAKEFLVTKAGQVGQLAENGDIRTIGRSMRSSGVTITAFGSALYLQSPWLVLAGLGHHIIDSNVRRFSSDLVEQTVVHIIGQERANRGDGVLPAIAEAGQALIRNTTGYETAVQARDQLGNNLIKYGIIGGACAGAAIGLVASGVYFTRALANILQHKYTQPKELDVKSELFTQSSEAPKSKWQKLISLFSKPQITKVIFNKEVSDKLQKTMSDLLKTKKMLTEGNSGYYSNILLCGPKGSGKSTLVRNFALKANMTLKEISGITLKKIFASESKTTDIINKLNQWIYGNKHSIIFIEDVDIAFEKDEIFTLSQLDFLTQIFAHRADVIFIVSAKDATHLNSEFMNYIGEKVVIDLPNVKARFEILKTYRDKMFLDIKNNINKQEISQNILSEDQLITIAAKTEGCTSAQLVEMLQNIKIHQENIDTEIVEAAIEFAKNTNVLIPAT